MQAHNLKIVIHRQHSSRASGCVFEWDPRILKEIRWRFRWRRSRTKIFIEINQQISLLDFLHIAFMQLWFTLAPFLARHLRMHWWFGNWFSSLFRLCPLLIGLLETLGHGQCEFASDLAIRTNVRITFQCFVLTFEAILTDASNKCEHIAVRCISWTITDFIYRYAM